MKKSVHLILMALVLWVAGCTRPPAEPAATSTLPDALVREAAGRAAFFEFYSPA